MYGKKSGEPCQKLCIVLRWLARMRICYMCSKIADVPKSLWSEKPAPIREGGL